ncbi:LD-carboxypeptidase, partial [Escherichia coli]|nr:LD-carboxypeptidase [Escherichia coli]
NQVLPYLNFDIIKKAAKPFIGYSDLTVILNAIFAKTKQPGFNYLLRNLVSEASKIQRAQFQKTFFENQIEINGKSL